MEYRTIPHRLGKALVPLALTGVAILGAGLRCGSLEPQIDPATIEVEVNGEPVSLSALGLSVAVDEVTDMAQVSIQLAAGGAQIYLPIVTQDGLLVTAGG